MYAASDVTEWGPTPTQYGLAVKPPFQEADLIADVPNDEELLLNLDRLQLSTILKEGDGYSISFDEACSRGSASQSTNWGQRAAFGVCKMGNKISAKVWPLGVYVVFPGTRWRRRVDGLVYAVCVFRDYQRGFVYTYDYCTASIDSDCRLASLVK